MITPETLDLVQKGGMLLLLMVAIGWLVADRNRLLKSISEKDAMIAEKDDKLASLSERCITTMTEFKVLLQSVVDIFNSTKRR